MKKFLFIFPNLFNFIIDVFSLVAFIISLFGVKSVIIITGILSLLNIVIQIVDYKIDPLGFKAFAYSADSFNPQKKKQIVAMLIYFSVFSLIGLILSFFVSAPWYYCWFYALTIMNAQNTVQVLIQSLIRNR